MIDRLSSVDMMALARDAQDADARKFRRPGAVRVMAPAKVNLFLAIGDKLPDGYHAATSIMHALLLHDVLWMKTEPQNAFWDENSSVLDEDVVGTENDALASESLRVSLSVRNFDGLEPLEVAPEDNIVVRAVRLLHRELGRSAGDRLAMHLEKHIPVQAGLGGGSSDAAAALVGAARLWGVETDDPRLEAVAQRLGADVPFFLRGGCACLTGKGDVFDHALKPMKKPVVLVKPSTGVSTAAAYRAFDASPCPIDAATVKRAVSAAAAEDVPLANNLMPASEGLLPELAAVAEWLGAQLGIESVLMSGSGSAFFGVCRTFAAAAAAAGAAKAAGWWARATTFSPAAAMLVPLR